MREEGRVGNDIDGEHVDIVDGDRKCNDIVHDIDRGLLVSTTVSSMLRHPQQPEHQYSSSKGNTK